MSADWTPPAEAVEAAAREAFWTDDLGGHHKPGSQPHTWENIPEQGRDAYRTMIRAALTAAYPAIVAEKDAEIERWRKWRDVAVRAHQKLAAVAALADEWQEHYDEQAPNAPTLIYGDGAMLIRHRLADQAAPTDEQIMDAFGEHG